ncbi:hydrogenase maturation protease [Chloroflexota bacterium]
MAGKVMAKPDNKIRGNMKTLILGIGNPILCDDAVGIEIARKIKEEKEELEIIETSEAGIALLDFVVDYEKLIIIDSIKIENGKPGELYKITLDDLKPAQDFSSSHGIGIATAFALGKKMKYNMPRETSIYAVHVEDNTNFSEECTDNIKRRIPSIVQQIINEEKL